MNILLLGSGGREHALAWKMSQSPRCGQLFIAPGNAGTAQHGVNIDLQTTDFESLAHFALEYRIDLILVGPELPLVKGIYDYFTNQTALRHIKVIGPSEEAAKLEGSKAYAKEFMREFGIPTAGYKEFTSETLEDGLGYLETSSLPIVLKADGLAAGKGVLICTEKEEAKQSLKEMLAGKFGEASSRVVIEEFLSGIEFSVFVVTDGNHYKILPVAKDYKRIGKGDTGLNTGGMGAVSPVSFVDDVLMNKVEKRIIEPTLRGIRSRNLNYSGFIFLGLIKVDDEPYVIEYNCRLGDPETEVVIPRLENDFIDLLEAIAEGNLKNIDIVKDKRACATIMLVSGGYPENYDKGIEITGLEHTEPSLVFHAGTLRESGKTLTNGGRVIAVSSFGKDFKEALAISNENAEKISFSKKYFRQDIGFDL